MDIQTRKLKFIEEFLKIQSEEVISKLEQALIDYNVEHFKAFSIEELNARIEQSLQDSKNDMITESNNLLFEIKQ